jgi:hypothetical protein
MIETNQTQPNMPMGNEGITVPGTAPIIADPKALRQQLDSRFSEIKNKEGALNSKRLLNKNLLKEKKNDLIRSMFSIMEEAGVDLNSMESISQFVKSLEQQDPDLAAMFESAFTGLVGEDAEAARIESESPNGGIMNKYKSLQQGIMMPQE